MWALFWAGALHLGPVAHSAGSTSSARPMPSKDAKPYLRNTGRDLRSPNCCNKWRIKAHNSTQQVQLPILEAGYASIRLKQGASLTITPQTLNFLGTSQAFESSGYTATIADVRLLSNFTGVGINTAEAERLNETTSLGTNVSKTVIGTSINLTGTTINTLYGSSSSTLTSTITLIGRDSGARITIPITVTKVN